MSLTIIIAQLPTLRFQLGLAEIFDLSQSFVKMWTSSKVDHVSYLDQCFNELVQECRHAGKCVYLDIFRSDCPCSKLGARLSFEWVQCLFAHQKCPLVCIFPSILIGRVCVCVLPTKTVTRCTLAAHIHFNFDFHQQSSLRTKSCEEGKQLQVSLDKSLR